MCGGGSRAELGIEGAFGVNQIVKKEDQEELQLQFGVYGSAGFRPRLDCLGVKIGRAPG